MAAKIKGMRIMKRVGIIIFTILIVLIIASLSLNPYLESLVKAELKAQIEQNSESLYKIGFENIDISVFRGNLTVTGLTSRPTEIALEKLHSGSTKAIISSKIEHFEIRGLKIYGFLMTGALEIKKLVIKDLTVKYLINNETEQAENKNSFVLHDIFSDEFSSLSLNKLNIVNASYGFLDISDTTHSIFDIDSVKVLVNDIYIDKKTTLQAIPVNFTNIQINTRLFALKSMKYYNITTTGINFNVEDTSLTINDFSLVPKYTKEEYNKRINYNNDWFSISTDKIILNGMNLKEFELSGCYYFNSINVYSPNIEIYRDKRLPDAPYNHKALISSLIKKIPIDVYIDTLKVNEGKLIYEEMLDLTDKPGMVFFDPLFLSAYNVTNISQKISENPHLQVDLQGKIMGKSNLYVNLDFLSSSPDDYFTAQGRLESIEGTEFNSMIESLMLANIKSGDVHSAEFNFVANDNESKGKLKLVYENLKVEILKHKDAGKKSGAWSFIANEFIIKNNLENNPKFRTGVINFERRKDKSIVNYLWNSVKTGLISTVAPIADKNKKKEKQEIKEQRKKTNKEEKQSRRAKKKNTRK